MNDQLPRIETQPAIFDRRRTRHRWLGAFQELERADLTRRVVCKNWEMDHRVYRQTIARWPNNRVAKHGLANLLRQRRCFEEALDLVPEPGKPVSLQDRYDLHLHGMILLDSGDADRAVAVFERALESALSAKSKAAFRSTLAMVRLKQQRYDEALRELSPLPSPTPKIHTLRLHAAAGSGTEDQAREIHTQLSARILTFPKPVRNSIHRITESWGLAGEGELRQPTQEQLDGVIEAEIDMLLAA